MSPLVLMLSSTAATVAADFSASAAARGGDCGHTCRPPPGFVEADLVAHSGPLTNGAFVQTLVDESRRARRPTRSARAPAVSVTAAAVSAARLRRRQRLRFHERDGSQLLCGREDRADSLPAQERFRRTLSRRTARSCGAWSSIGGTRASGSRAAGEALCAGAVVRECIPAVLGRDAYRRADRGEDSADRHIRLGPAHGVARRTSSPDIAAEAESRAWPAAPGPACCGDG